MYAILTSFLIFALSAAAGSTSQCGDFYRYSTSRLSARNLGPIGLEMKRLLSAKDKAVHAALEQLDKVDKNALQKLTDTQKNLASELEEIPTEDVALHIKQLVKNGVLFSRTHEFAFSKATHDVLGIYFFEGRRYIRRQEEKFQLQAFEKLLVSELPKDKEKINEVLAFMVDIFKKTYLIPEWFTLDSVKKAEKATAIAWRWDLKTTDQIVYQVDQLQQFFHSPYADKILTAALRHSLARQTQLMIASKIPTWKTLATNVGAVATQATGTVLGAAALSSSSFGEPVMWITGGIMTLALGANTIAHKPSLKGFLERRKLKKESTHEDEVDNLISKVLEESTPHANEEKINLSEIREDKEDGKFTKIIKELESNLSIENIFTLQIWGNEFQTGFANTAQRHLDLDQRLTLISQELNPMLQVLKDSAAPAHRLSAFHRLVEVSGTQIQNLILDIAFLRNDYLALAVVLDRYVEVLNNFELANSLSPAQQELVKNKGERFKQAKQLLLLSAERTNRLLEQVNGVGENLNDFHEVILAELTLGSGFK
jgi:hypothetical protein